MALALYSFSLLICFTFACAQNPVSDSDCINTCKFEFSSQSNQQDSPLIETPPHKEEENATKLRERICQQYETLKECVLGCDEGYSAWQTMSDFAVSNGAAAQLRSTCEMDIGGGDAESDVFQDVICAQSCQVKAGKEIAKILPPEPPSEDESLFDPNSNATSLLEQQRRICEVQTEMQNCVLACKGGQKMWETFYSDTDMTYCKARGGRLDGTSSEQCPLHCQQTASIDISSIPMPGNGSGDDVTPEQYSKYQKNVCKIYKEMKACTLVCDNGDVAWQEVWDTNTEHSNGGSMLEVCGLGPNSTSADGGSPFQDTICAQDCQIEMGKQVTDVTGVGSPEEQTQTESVFEIIKRQRLICEAYEGLKTCVLGCSGGAQIWDSVFSGPEMGFANILQGCQYGLPSTDT